MSKKKSKKKHKERKRKRSSSSSDDEETCDKTENTRERKSSEAKKHHRARSRSEDKDNEKKRRRFSDSEPAKYVTHSRRSREKEYRKAVCKQGIAKASDKSSSLQGKQETVSKSCSDELQADTIAYKRPTNWKASLFEMRLLRPESEGRPAEKTLPREHQGERGKLMRNSSKSSKERVTHSKSEANGLDTYHTLGRAVSSVGQSKDETLAAFKKDVASNSPEHSLKEQYSRNERTEEYSSALRKKTPSKPAMFGKTISFRIPKKSKPFESAVSDTKSKSCLSICDKKTLSQRCQDRSGSDVRVSCLSPSRSSEKLKSSTVSKPLSARDVQHTSSSTKATSQESDVDAPTESHFSRMTGDGIRKKRPLHAHKEKEKAMVAYNKKLILYEEDSEIPSVSSEAPNSHDTDQEMQLVVELHAARSEKLLEMKVVQSYGELTCMDIDLPEEKTNFKGSSHQDLLIVLDTNILLSHLEFVRTIKAHGLPGIGFPAIIIPWVVLQELDSLKNGKLSMHVVKKAIPAVNFIYTCLKNQDPQLWGQSMQQASQSIYGLSGENNDDRVLQCCLQYQSLYPNLTIILCTNDKNLCSKALLSGVKAVSKVDLVSELENLKFTAETHKHHAVQVTWSSKSEESERDRNDSEAERREAAALALGPEVASIVSILEECLGKVLSAVLEKEMKIAFDDLWIEIVYLKPPWTLPDLLQCFKKHWIAVFGQIVCRDLLSSIDILYDNLYKGRKIDSTIIKLVLQEAHQFLQAFKSRSDYDGVLPQAFAVVSGLLQDGSQSDCKTQEQSTLDAGSGTALPRGRVSPLPSDDETLMSDEQNPLEPRPSHKEVWAIFENIWSTVCQYSTAVFATFNYPYAPGVLLPDGKLPPPDEAYACLQKLLAAVKELLACFQRVLAQNSCFKDVQNLYTFIASSEITTVGQRFTAQEMYECLTQQEYREKLSMGWSQLAELNFNLEQCNTAVCMEARARGWM
ncbi:transcriptional protein SWT1 isoform X2 [Polyodon spathula]|uniref:transcriptional protein SWT1 isoform X2 n=1 Tax=Polyodon spathula TaxID=7913 RepID=UPI001B7ED936|nr:transcriptional protein SWT1 isoform X2 [Polyodon spathula]